VAVDYYHFLVVSGPRPAVTDFVHRIALVIDRRAAGKTVRQEVPFSFESMYAIAKIKGDHPGEAFDMMRWPIARRGRGAEVQLRVQEDHRGADEDRARFQQRANEDGEWAHVNGSC